MDLSIIIVNWNSKDYLRKCIASILANTIGIKFEIIVIDSASYDGCGEMLRKSYPEVQFIQSDTNLGFAKANNKAFKVSKGEDLLFLNPDTVIKGSAITKMYNYLRTLSYAGVLGCKLLNADYTLQLESIQAFPNIINQSLDFEVLKKKFHKLNIWGKKPLYSNILVPKTVDVVSGACLMIKRDVFLKVGLWNSDYFMYSEDVEICYNVWRLGYRVYFTNEAKVIHYGGKSINSKSLSHFSIITMKESRLNFFFNTKGKTYANIYRSSIFVFSIIRIMVLLIWHLLCRKRRHEISNSLFKWKSILKWTFKAKIEQQL